ncbi:MAG TPA: response regulator transcription factor [Chitinophagales bacterium]|nr:response regulator transcription factor [Chitinophagales bacterium]
MLTPINILAIDNHPLFVQGMLSCLRQWNEVGKATGCNSYDEMFEHLKEDQPHLIFLELNLNTSHYDGFSICREVTSRYKNVFVAILSRYNAPELIREARDCGARAFIDKNTSPEKLYDFLQDFWQGKILQYYVRVSNGYSRTGVLQDGFELRTILTRREREVMCMIVEGCDHDEIENNLKISYSTYKTHRNNILRKLAVKNDVELTRFAVSNNLCTTGYSSVPNNSAAVWAGHNPFAKTTSFLQSSNP